MRFEKMTAAISYAIDALQGTEFKNAWLSIAPNGVVSYVGMEDANYIMCPGPFDHNYYIAVTPDVRYPAAMAYDFGFVNFCVKNNITV